MHEPTAAAGTLADKIVDRLESLLLEAERENKPLEVDPYRRQLFELFVMADAAGYTDEDGAPDLSAAGLCRLLAERWELADATRDSFERQEKLPPEHVSKMRVLWAMMRMWMEWAYAWKRWEEFHAGR